MKKSSCLSELGFSDPGLSDAPSTGGHTRAIKMGC